MAAARRPTAAELARSVCWLGDQIACGGCGIRLVARGGGGISRCCKAYHTYTQKRRLTAKIDPAASRRWQRPLSLNVRLLTKQILVDAKSQDEGTVSSRRRGTPTLRISRGSDTLQLSRGSNTLQLSRGFQYPTNIAEFLPYGYCRAPSLTDIV